MSVEQSDEEAQTVARIARIFGNLGGSPDQSLRMARQLWKRSAQIAEERRISRLEALDHLLRLAISGVQGVPPPHSTGDEV